MNIEKIIDKKVEELNKEIDERGVSAAGYAKGVLKKFVDEIKGCIDLKPITGEDLLQVIQNGGVVFRKLYFAGDDSQYTADIQGALYDLRQRIVAADMRRKYATCTVTLIIEPVWLAKE